MKNHFWLFVIVINLIENGPNNGKAMVARPNIGASKISQTDVIVQPNVSQRFLATNVLKIQDDTKVC